VLGVPAAGALSGEASGTSAAGDIAAPAAPTTPSRGGKFVFKDKSGAILHSYDEPLESARSQVIINNALGGLRESATTERERSAADAAIKAGANFLQGGSTIKESADLALSMYGRAVAGQGYKKTYEQSPGGGGPAGPTKTDIKLSELDRKTTNEIIHRVETTEHVRAAADSETDALQGLQYIRQMQSGMGDFAAFAKWLQSISGKVVTDRERQQFMGSEGVWTGISNEAGKYVNGGRFDEAFMRQLEKVFMGSVQRAREKRAQAAKTAQGEARGMGLSDAAVDVVGGHFTGEFGGTTARQIAPDSSKPASPGGGGGLSPAASSYLKSRGGGP
jgi:hypothetical protein